MQTLVFQKNEYWITFSSTIKYLQLLIHPDNFTHLFVPQFFIWLVLFCSYWLLWYITNFYIQTSFLVRFYLLFAFEKYGVDFGKVYLDILMIFFEVLEGRLWRIFKQLSSLWRSHLCLGHILECFPYLIDGIKVDTFWKNHLKIIDLKMFISISSWWQFYSLTSIQNLLSTTFSKPAETTFYSFYCSKILNHP